MIINAVVTRELRCKNEKCGNKKNQRRVLMWNINNSMCGKSPLSNWIDDIIVVVNQWRGEIFWMDCKIYSIIIEQPKWLQDEKMLVKH
jgi:hypothetical protein